MCVLLLRLPCHRLPSPAVCPTRHYGKTPRLEHHLYDRTLHPTHYQTPELSTHFGLQNFKAPNRPTLGPQIGQLLGPKIGQLSSPKLPNRTQPWTGTPGPLPTPCVSVYAIPCTGHPIMVAEPVLKRPSWEVSPFK